MANNSTDIHKTYNRRSPQINEDSCYVILGHALIATTFETENRDLYTCLKNVIQETDYIN